MINGGGTIGIEENGAINVCGTICARFYSIVHLPTALLQSPSVYTEGTLAL